MKLNMGDVCRLCVNDSWFFALMGEVLFFAPPKTNSPGANLDSRRLARRAKSMDGLRKSTQKKGGPEGLVAKTTEYTRPLRSLAHALLVILGPFLQARYAGLLVRICGAFRLANPARQGGSLHPKMPAMLGSA
ncbi:MAG TPA: hypothetical protein VM011_07375 [Gammaproteobacteria bacterium]|nr:hypothetical protein [Gammaproteobacteria bacterium]